MNRRTFEGPMDWEYHGGGPADASSPFTQFSQRAKMANPQAPSPSKYAAYGRQGPNPFAAATSSPAKGDARPLPPPPPPQSSIFSPQIHNRQSAPQFRNPSFTTPQKRVDDIVYSELSGVDSSPALTEASEAPADTPDVDGSHDMAAMTMTPSTTHRSFFSELSSMRGHAAGRGELVRARFDAGRRNKVRKRKRLPGDRDVGSARPRLPHGSDDSDSDYEGVSPRKASGPAQQRDRGSRVGGVFSAIQNYPHVPQVLTYWLQLSFNIILVGLVLWILWAIIAAVRSDLNLAADQARGELLAEMEACAHEYTKNRCAPRADRLPALDKVCDEWEHCMNRDASAVMKVQATVKNVAQILNGFTQEITYKSFGFIITLFVLSVLAVNVGLGKSRAGGYHSPVEPASSVASQPAMPPLLTPGPGHNMNQAFIWAPVGQTPRHIKRGLLGLDETDTDASPAETTRAMLPAPVTPSRRRSPSKGERSRSPVKGSPVKGY